MNAYSEKFILQLIKKIDKPEGLEPQYRIHITDHAYRWYFALSNSDKEVLHHEMESIADIKIQYQRRVSLGAFKHIEYIQIINCRSLMESQGVMPQVDEIQTALQSLNTAEFDVPWWNNTKSEIAKAWSQNKTYCGVKRDCPEHIIDAMKTVECIVQSIDTNPTPDMRTLSAMLYGDSKQLEKKSFANLIRKLMLPYLEDDIVSLVGDGKQLLEYFGITKYPIPIRFKARGTLLCQGAINLSALRYGIGVSPDEVKGIEWSEQPAYVLFIENPTCFERYVREIDDSGLIIYTAGFPPRSWSHVMEILITELNDSVPIYHWGDRDVGGYRILSFLAKRLDTDIKPYRMGVKQQVQTTAGEKLDEKPVAELMQALESARGYPEISALYKDLAELPLENLPWIEQEQLTPESPLAHDCRPL